VGSVAHGSESCTALSSLKASSLSLLFGDAIKATTTIASFLSALDAFSAVTRPTCFVYAS